MSTVQRVSARGRGSFLSAADPDEQKKSRKKDAKSLGLVKVNWQIRPEWLEAVKVRAVKSKRKVYEILDEALEQYLTTKAS